MQSFRPSTIRAPMFSAVLVLLAVTPVSLSVDLSRDTTARLGPRVRTLMVERLEEEGFTVEPGSKLKLRVEELHGTLRLSAQAGGYSADSELRPSLEWPAELGFELAQRLAVLAHEAEAHVPAPAPVVEAPPAPEPEPPPQEKQVRLGAGLRLGILVRADAVDPTLAFHGSFPTGVVEPVVTMGLVFAPGPGLTAWELPVTAGLRVPIILGAWTLSPELLGGGRLHLFSEGVRIDPLLMLGLSLLRSLGALKLGARLGLDVSTAREHREGDLVLWSRGGFAFSAMLQLER